MREILFRGKQRVNGEWVYGDFMHGNERKSLRDSIFVYDSETQSFDNYVIDSSTIGQYTGLTDKNGKKIFEGDIVFGKNYTGLRREGYVSYSSGLARYVIIPNTISKYRESDCIEDLCPVENYLTIIGNIHDNPELLKGDKDNE